MVGCLSRLFGRDPRAQTLETDDETARALTARSLADSLARALDLGHHAHAGNLVERALPFLDVSAPLAELVARAALDDGDPATAVVAITTAPQMTTALRRLRIIAWQQLGRHTRARRELRRWSVEPNAPMDIGRRLALAEWDAGDAYAAKSALLRNLTRCEDPSTLETIVLVSKADGRTEPARLWSDRWEHAAISPPAHRALLLETLGLGTWPATAPPETARVTQLAVELHENETVIPTLVEAQRRRPDPSANRLLAAALAKAVETLARPRVAIEALAHLALLRGETAVAADWVDTGLAESPNAVGLLTLREQLIDHSMAGVAGRLRTTRERAA